MAEFARRARERNEVLRYIGEVDVALGTATLGLRSYPLTHPLATVQEGEMVVAITSQRYAPPTPLVLRGPGAGSAVTASAILADLLRLSKTLN